MAKIQFLKPTFSFMDKTKSNYFLGHLATSFIVILIATAVSVFNWFPYPFVMLDGTWKALTILAVIDLILGPLLTLLLVSSKKSKKELFFDLSVIISIQVAAFSYGLLTIKNERILALVHMDGAFHMISAKDIHNQNLVALESLQQYKNYPIAHIPNSAIHNYLNSQNLPLLFSIPHYTSLDEKELIEYQILYENLPEEIQNNYSNEFIFKILVGKKRNAVVIINTKLDIVNIELLPYSE